MQVLSALLGSISALVLPAFLVLYFLKRRHEEIHVPSTQLWQQALSTLHADKPWQRLRSSLLFFVQLAAILLLIFACFRPVTRTSLPSEMVVILDASGSMRATDTAPSRFERAREEARKLISSLPEGGRVTLISAGEQPIVVVSRTTDRLTASRALDALQSGNGDAAMDEALQLASAIRRETGAGIAVLSDRYTGPYSIPVGGGGANRAVESVAASRVNGKLQALCSVRSFGYTGTATVECRADGKLVDAKEANLTPGEPTVVYWTQLPDGAREINVRLTDADALAADDSADCIVSAGKTPKVLLVTEKNVFLEAALKLREDIELYKQPPDAAAALSGYDLYVFDGALPKALPKDGNSILVNPTGEIAGLKALAGGSGVLAAAQGAEAAALLQNVNMQTIQVAKSSALTGWQPVAWLGKDAAIASAEVGGQRLIALGFDLHDSNLPMLKDFPILMRNLLSWVLSDATGGVTAVRTGESVPLLPHALAAKIDVVKPSGKAVQAAPPFPAAAFDGTDELGVYEIRQYSGDGKELADARCRFAVNAATATESDLQASETLPALADAGKLAAAQSVDWWLFAALAALALILGEWMVARYGH